MKLNVFILIFLTLPILSNAQKVTQYPLQGIEGEVIGITTDTEGLNVFTRIYSKNENALKSYQVKPNKTAELTHEYPLPSMYIKYKGTFNGDQIYFEEYKKDYKTYKLNLVVLSKNGTMKTVNINTLELKGHGIGTNITYEDLCFSPNGEFIGIAYLLEKEMHTYIIDKNYNIVHQHTLKDKSIESAGMCAVNNQGILTFTAFTAYKNRLSTAKAKDMLVFTLAKGQTNTKQLITWDKKRESALCPFNYNDHTYLILSEKISSQEGQYSLYKNVDGSFQKISTLAHTHPEKMKQLTQIRENTGTSNLIASRWYGGSDFEFEGEFGFKGLYELTVTNDHITNINEVKTEKLFNSTHIFSHQDTTFYLYSTQRSFKTMRKTGSYVQVEDFDVFLSTSTGKTPPISLLTGTKLLNGGTVALNNKLYFITRNSNGVFLTELNMNQPK